MSRQPVPSRIQGSLFGLAICDALGGPVEFKTRGTFPLITDLEPNTNFSYLQDASRMTHQVKKYVAWSRDGYMSSVPERGCFDIGIGTQSVLRAWSAHYEEHGYGKEGSELARAVREEGQQMIDSMFRREGYCGNGSLMRVIPIALTFHAAGVERAIHYARESSKVTHPHPRCQEACAVYTKLAVMALQGSEKAALAEAVATESIRDEQLRDRLSSYKSLDFWRQQTESNIRSTGYVIDTLEAALWAFFTTDTFEHGAIRAVNLGHDADTVAAVYGGLAGAYYGFDAIPDRWVRDMRNKDLLARISQELEALEGNAGSNT